ncbi:unnamed protein product [Paramecium pentaurelia]|uniref:Uncharacterized protein n=2 Tax=Paramecium TaxID=5884 RepID=A0A8S1VAK2_9CILI|nr:unnamed protein product [Paramecium pentaurelia]
MKLQRMNQYILLLYLFSRISKYQTICDELQNQMNQIKQQQQHFLNILRQYQERLVELTNKNESKTHLIIELLNKEEQLQLQIRQMQITIDRLTEENNQLKSDMLPYGSISEVKQLVEQFKQIHAELSQ